jgi:hypothetical protein
MRSALAVVVLVLVALGGSAARAEPSVDWAGGKIAVTAAAAADLRLPTPAIARVAAERTARGRARKELLVAARALPWAGGGTLGTRADADPETLRALDLAVDGATTDDVSIQSDGSVVLRLSASLDALAGLSPNPGAPGVVVDGRKHAVAPAVGYHIVAGKESYSGPLRFARSASGHPAGSVTRVKGDEIIVSSGALDRMAPPVVILIGDAK